VKRRQTPASHRREIADRPRRARPRAERHREPGARRLLELGLARLEAGDYEEALRGFALAERSPSLEIRRLAVHNRGIALLRLSRFDEAETTLLEAARLSPGEDAEEYLAAAVAAVQRRALARAAGYLDRASAADPGGALSLSIGETRQVVGTQVLDDAAQALGQGRWELARSQYRLAAALASGRRASPAELAEIQSTLGYLDFKLGDFQDARARFTTARTLRPDDGDNHFMLARTALELGDPEEAARGFEATLSASADSETRSAARDRIDALSAGLRAEGAGLGARVDVLGGYDTNVPQSAVLADASRNESGASAFASVGAAVAYGLDLGRRAFTQAEYDFGQVAYSRGLLDRYGLQVHTLSLSGELTRGPWRLLVPVEGGLEFAGVRGFSPLERTLSVRPTLSLDESVRSATSVDLGETAKQAGSAALAALGGRRLELGLRQTLRRYPGDAGGVSARAFLRREWLGNQVLTGPDDPGCAASCFVVPLGHREAGVSLNGGWRFHSGVRLDAAASGQWRRYDGEAPFGHVSGGAFVVDLRPGRTREDVRLESVVLLQAPLGETLTLVLRYETVLNRSNINDGAPGHAFDFGNKNFLKEALALGVSAHW
jgi:tetratricopeptide (TPR) repeat protein